MKQTAKIKGRAMTIPGGLAYASAISIFLTILMSGSISLALEKGWLPFEKSGYAVMLLLFLTAVSGGIAASKRIKHQILAVCIANGVIYFLLLMSITALFYGGQYSAVGETGLVIAAGSSMAALLCLKGKNSGKKKR